ncbi:hypothetical protein LTS18_001972 [Coniosporium uncinatum]|uniref:Uncharacterized protein n=1 Tax=Coniosporium uncinatum TaxID=93489 RepID=A0ACC3DUS7_9PEZI|nr:hypothetical protein LTS18_001972 [Coniosporium uncinatum]
MTTPQTVFLNDSTVERQILEFSEAADVSMDCMQSPSFVQLPTRSDLARNTSEVMTVHDGARTPHHASTQRAAGSTVKAIRAYTPARARRLDGFNEIYQKLKAEELVRLRSFDPTIVIEGAEIFNDNEAITDITQRPEELVVLRLLYLLKGSAYSLIALQQTMQAARRGTKLLHQQPRAGSSSADYLQVIEALTTTESYCAMLKRCYTVRMFAKGLETLCSVDGTFETETPQSLCKRAERSAGNPKNKSKSVAIDTVMNELYPGLAATAPQYGKKRRLVGDLRRLATRLHMFTAKFGFGILALLPLYLCPPDKHTVDSR